MSAVGWALGDRKISGTAIPIGPRCAVTCGHVAAPGWPPSAGIERPRATPRQELKLRNGHGWFKVGTPEFLFRAVHDEDETVWEPLDAAVLELPPEAPSFRTQIPLLTSVSDEAWTSLRRHELAIVGFHPGSTEPELRRVTEDVEVHTSLSSSGKLLALDIRRRTDFGNSGGALLATIEGHPYCVGMLVSGGPKQHCSVVLSADRIVEFLDPTANLKGWQIRTAHAFDVLRTLAGESRADREKKERDDPSGPHRSTQNNFVNNGTHNGTVFDQRGPHRG